MAKQVILKEDISPEDYLDISLNKLRDSCVLFTNKRYEGACYNVGYTAECLIKYVFLKEFKCSSREDIDKLSNNPESEVRNIYGKSINDFAITILGIEYSRSENNIGVFKKLAEEIYKCVLKQHAFEYGLKKLFDSRIDLNYYKHILDWSENWRYRSLTQEINIRFKNSNPPNAPVRIMDKRTNAHDINDEAVCKQLIVEISNLIKQFHSSGLISQRDYDLKYKSVIEEVSQCLNTSVL